MALQDDLWAYERLKSMGDIAECSSFRILICNTVHRFVRLQTQNNQLPWRALCGLHHGGEPGLLDDRPVDCLGCLAEGG